MAKTTTTVTPGSLGGGRVRVRIEETRNDDGRIVRQRMVQIPRKDRLTERKQ